MSVGPDPGFWKEAATWLWTLLLLPMGALWAMFNQRMSRVETKSDAALPISSFERHEDLSRDEVKDLNLRVDALRESVERKIDDLRRDMNGGFTSIRDEIRHLHK